MRAPAVQSRLRADATRTPWSLPIASIVWPSPSEMATWAFGGHVGPGSTGLPASSRCLNNNAPRVAMASSTVMMVPLLLHHRCWIHDPSGIVGCTPARPHAHSTSSEQSNAVGFGSVMLASALATYRSPCCARASCTTCSTSTMAIPFRPGATYLSAAVERPPSARWLRAQEGEHRQDAAMVVGLRFQPELGEDRTDV